mgnify:CR=1 FL=1
MHMSPIYSRNDPTKVLTGFRGGCGGSKCQGARAEQLLLHRPAECEEFQ